MKTVGAYKMASVVRMTGFTPALLRAWEKRYDVLHPARALGGHRLYTEDDLKILFRIKSLIAQGRSIGEIALFGRENLLEALPARGMSGKESQWTGKLAEPRLINGKAESLPWGESTAINGQFEKCANDIVQAAVAIDSAALEIALNQAFSLVPPEVAIREVLEPSATKIGELWAKGTCSVAGEHLASGIFVHRLQKLIESSRPQDRPAQTAICACFPDEQHQVGTLVLAYYLCLHGISVSYLGASLPFEELEHACRLIAPRAVYLSVTRPVLYLTHRPRLIEMLRRHAGSSAFYIGGGGITAEDPELEQLGAKVWIGKYPLAGLTDNLLPK
jgi:DNA-binding transcriptional MerR regulator/methylmalonyl-CoA mutase cobalamin-binding subunit